VSVAGSILICDDDAAIRTVVTQALRRAGHRVTAAASLTELKRELRGAMPDVVVTDVVLPDGNGLDLVATLTGEYPDLPVIVLSAQNTLATAVRATEAGAFDYLPKPFDLDALTTTVASALSRGRRLVDDVAANEDHAVALIGRSPAMQDVYRVIARVVSNELTVLITGESGTGKELVAQAIHDLGPRRNSARRTADRDCRGRGCFHGGSPARPIPCRYRFRPGSVRWLVNARTARSPGVPVASLPSRRANH
jgi:two-component system nitrogen regulation response regulator GlnG